MGDPATRAIRQYLDVWTPRIEATLDRLLPPAGADPLHAGKVHEAMRYAVFGGGKRLRPALVLLGARAAGGDEASVLGVAAAVELVHTYSLIHDDLPAMDDDDMRRGRPSCHVRFGEAVAILAGDALNTHAFAVLAAEAPRPETVRDLVNELCRAAGTAGMVGGQAADLAAEGEAPDLARVRWVHERKTAALLAASLRMGAVAVGGARDLVARLDAYGRRMGLAFQVIDDVLDEEGLAADLGKTPGKDRARGKITYPAAVGVAESRRIAEELLREAETFVSGLPGAETLASLDALVLTRRS